MAEQVASARSLSAFRSFAKANSSVPEPVVSISLHIVQIQYDRGFSRPYQFVKLVAERRSSCPKARRPFKSTIFFLLALAGQSQATCFSYEPACSPASPDPPGSTASMEQLRAARAQSGVHTQRIYRRSPLQYAATRNALARAPRYQRAFLERFRHALRSSGIVNRLSDFRFSRSARFAL